MKPVQIALVSYFVLFTRSYASKQYKHFLKSTVGTQSRVLKIRLSHNRFDGLQFDLGLNNFRYNLNKLLSVASLRNYITLRLCNNILYASSINKYARSLKFRK